MKHPAAYYLLLLYITVLCRPLMPVAKDIVAHIFFEHQHIASVHQQGGKNHVEKEVGKLAQHEDSNSSTNTKGYEDVPLHLAIVCQFQFQDFQLFLKHNSYPPGCFFPPIALAIQLPPPRV